MIDYRPMIQLGDYLRLNALRFPDRPCFVRSDGSALTYAETNSRVNRLADALAARGMTRGTRLAILAVDSCEYYEVILASLKLGATYVPLNNRLADGEVATLLERASPKALFVSSRYVDTARRVAPDVPGIDLLVDFDLSLIHI